MHKDINVNVSGPVQPTSTYKTVVLKGNHSFAAQVTEPNTKYVIKHDFVLDGDVTIPENCVLEFDGGSISGNGSYKITGNNTTIIAESVFIFKNVILNGNNCFKADIIHSSWWINNTVDNTEEFQNLLSSITAFNNKNVCIENNIRITDGNLTNKYTRGIRFYSNVDYAFKQVGITVFGSNSQGLDISGCEGVEFENVLFIGDNNNPPKTLLYSSRTQANLSAWYHRFINCWFSGSASITLLYNYAGECWELVNCQFRPASNMECVVYFTATNDIGLTSKFANTASAPNYSTPLTDTSFKECSFFNYEDNPTIVFEANHYDPNTISSEIGFYHCYFKSTKHNTARFIGITSNISFINCTDESSVGYNPSVYTRNTPHYEFLNYDNEQISWLTGVIFSNNNLFGCDGVSLITCNNHVKKLISEANNYSGNVSLDFLNKVNDSIFNDLDVFTQLNIATSGNTIVNTSDKSKINIGSSTIKGVTKNSFNIIEDINPYEHYNAADNAIVKRSIFELYYLGVGSSIYDWKELSIKKYTNLFSPTRGINFKKGQVIYANDPLANGFIGAVATSDGTTGDLNVTFSTIPNTNTISVSSVADLRVGQTIYITDNSTVWVNRVITEINAVNKIVTYSGSALSVAITNMPLYWAKPNLRPFGMLNITAANNTGIQTTSLLKGFGFFNTTSNKMEYWNGTAWV